MYLRVLAMMSLVALSPGSPETWFPQPVGKHKYALVDIRTVWKRYEKYHRGIEEADRKFREYEAEGKRLRKDIADLRDQLANPELLADDNAKLSESLRQNVELWNTTFRGSRWTFPDHGGMQIECARDFKNCVKAIAEERGLLLVLPVDTINLADERDRTFEGLTDPEDRRQFISKIFTQSIRYQDHLDITDEVIARLNDPATEISWSDGPKASAADGQSPSPGTGESYPAWPFDFVRRCETGR